MKLGRLMGASRLSVTLRSLSAMAGKVVTVTSGKGGVGKTTTAGKLWFYYLCAILIQSFILTFSPCYSPVLMHVLIYHSMASLLTHSYLHSRLIALHYSFAYSFLSRFLLLFVLNSIIRIWIGRFRTQNSGNRFWYWIEKLRYTFRMWETCYIWLCKCVARWMYITTSTY